MTTAPSGLWDKAGSRAVGWSRVAMESLDQGLPVVRPRDSTADRR